MLAPRLFVRHRYLYVVGPGGSVLPLALESMLLSA
jgi:hypothetical protein